MGFPPLGFSLNLNRSHREGRRCVWRWRDSPLTGSIRTAAGTAAGSAPRTATASCRRSDDVSLFCPSATGTPVFTSASSAAYALLNAAASWRGRRNIHPHVPVIRRAMRGKKKRRHGLGREGGGKKSLLARPQARCAISPHPVPQRTASRTTETFIVDVTSTPAASATDSREPACCA